LRVLPADLAAIVALVVATNIAVFVPVINETPLRILVGLVFVLFVPGYAFIAALFPEAGESPTDADVDREFTAQPATTAEGAADDDEAGVGDAAGLRDRGIDGIERVALSFGLSIAIVPLIGLVLNFTPFGIRLVPIVVSLSGFTLGTTAIAAIRRWELPPQDRFRVPYREWVAAGHAELFEPDSRTDAALNVLLAISVLLAVGSVAYAVAVPPQGEQFTEFYILTEDDDGELVADDYPEELVVGEPTSLHVGIGNNEYETVNYTVVIQLQSVAIEEVEPDAQSDVENGTEGDDPTGNQTRVRVLERAQLDRYPTTLEHNETAIEERSLLPSGEVTGDELRLTFLLYRGTPPAQPTRETAYRNLHLWVTVSGTGNAGEVERVRVQS
jgi:uncharacterized membrane protein